MSRGNFIGAQFYRIIQKSFELDLRIAENVRVWSTASPVFVQEMYKNLIPVFPGKINRP